MSLTRRGGGRQSAASLRHCHIRDQPRVRTCSPTLEVRFSAQTCRLPEPDRAVVEGTTFVGSAWPGRWSPWCWAGPTSRPGGDFTGRARQTLGRGRTLRRYGRALHPGSRSTTTGCMADKTPAPLGADVRYAAAPLERTRLCSSFCSNPNLLVWCITAPVPGSSGSRCSRRRSPIIGSGGSLSAAGAAGTVPATLLIPKLPGVTVG